MHIRYASSPIHQPALETTALTLRASSKLSHRPPVVSHFYAVDATFEPFPFLLFQPDVMYAKMAMLDGIAQLWQNSPQWFCLVCRHLLEMNVLIPSATIHYFFREDNNNDISVSPFLWEVGLCCALLE